MGPVSVTTTIDASRDSVFDAICDLALRPAWCDHFMTDFRLARIPAAGKGAAARFRVEPPGFHGWMGTEITEARRSHLISEDGRVGRTNRVPVHMAWELSEGPGAVTTVRLTFWTEPAVVTDRLRELLGARRWYRRRWSKALRRLAGVLEEAQPRERIGVGGADVIPAVAGPEV